MVRRAWQWLWSSRRFVDEPNAKCPICGQPVVAEPDTMPGGAMAGPMFMARTREELVAACATHGHPPLNDKTTRWLAAALGSPSPDGR